MDDIARLRDELGEHILMARATGDLAPLFDATTLRSVERLLESSLLLAAVVGSSPDLDVLELAGTFFWLRSQAPERGGSADYRRATILLRRVFAERRVAVPLPLHREFEARAESHAEQTAALIRSQVQAFRRSGDPSTFLSSVSLLTSAVTTLPAGDVARTRYAIDLADLYFTCYDQTGEVESAAESVLWARRAVREVRQGGRDHAFAFDRLAVALTQVHMRIGDVKALRAAIAAEHTAHSSSSRDDPNYPLYLTNLCNHYCALFEATGEPAALDSAVGYGRAALASAPVGDPNRAPCANNLAATLAVVYENTQSMAVLTEATDAAREAVRATDPGDSALAGRRNNLGTMLRLDYDRTGRTESLTESTAAFRSAVSGVFVGVPEYAMYLGNLAVGQLAGYDLDYRIDDLNEAIGNLREALRYTPLRSRSYARALVNLAGALRRRYVVTANADGINEAVECAQAAVAAVPRGDRDRMKVLSTLGMALATRYGATGDIADLEGALAADRAAVADAAAGPARCSALDNLCGTLRKAYVRTGQSRFVVEGVEHARACVAVTRDDDRLRSARLGTLAIALIDLDELGLQQGAAAEAEVLLAQACDGPSDAETQAVNLCNFGIVMHRRYKRTGNANAAREAARLCGKALALTSADNPSRGARIGFAGMCHFDAYECDGTAAQLESAKAQLIEAADSQNTRNSMRMTFAIQAARAQLRGGDPAAALAAVERAAALLPLAASADLHHHDQEFVLGDFSDIASTCAAVAIEAGSPRRAVELLEQVRGLLSVETGGLLSGVMRRLPPERAELGGTLVANWAVLRLLDRFRAVSGGYLDAPETTLETAASDLDTAAQRRKYRADLDEAITEVRRLPGFERFLSPLSIEHLVKAARRAPVVYVMAQETRCDALVLSGDGRILPIALPDMDRAKAIACADRLSELRRTAADADAEPSDRAAAQRSVLNELALLWDAVTGPILDALGLTAPAPPAGAAWPGIHWCPVGVMSRLPLHSAGHHDDVPDRPGGPRTVMDRAVSTYTTTARNLVEATPMVVGKPCTPMVVVQTDGPEPFAPLTRGMEEAAEVLRLMPTTLVQINPSPSAVREALIDHGIVHFACHGLTDPYDPSLSRLVLRDDGTSPLTVASIGSVLAEGGLAFLSACETASCPLWLADEFVHVTNAFQLAGYRHVIGTLWQVDEHSSLAMSTLFYRALTHDGRRPLPDLGESASALHSATRWMRNAYPNTPTMWAAFTHTGLLEG